MRRSSEDRAKRLQWRELDPRSAVAAGHCPDVEVTFSESPAKFRETTGASPALREAMATLSPGQRDAIELLKLRELSLKEAAEATGLSVGALKVATHRAMAALRRKLARHSHGH